MNQTPAIVGASNGVVEEQQFRAVMQAIVEAPDGFQKNASEDAGDLIRLKLRETGFQRGHILPFKPLKPSELTKSLTSELPWKIEEMESKQPNAVTLNYNDTTDYSNYKLDKFPMYFHTLMTPTFVKHVLELINYTNDPREIVTNNMLLDLQSHSQERPVPAPPSGASGYVSRSVATGPGGTPAPRSGQRPGRGVAPCRMARSELPDLSVRRAKSNSPRPG